MVESVDKIAKELFPLQKQLQNTISDTNYLTFQNFRRDCEKCIFHIDIISGLTVGYWKQPKEANSNLQNYGENCEKRLWLVSPPTSFPERVT